MMGIMMIRSGPERQEVVQAPGKLIATVGVDGLEQPEGDPNVHGQDVEVAGECGPQDRRAHRSDSQDQGFYGRAVLSRETERGRVLMMDLMDVLVEGAPMQCSMGPIMPGIFHDEEDRNLIRHGEERREGNIGGETEVLGEWMKQPAPIRNRHLDIILSKVSYQMDGSSTVK